MASAGERILRDPKRISLIVRGIEILWKRSPELRLNQLLMGLGIIGNPMKGEDGFYWEDDKIEEILKKKIGENHG